jgi:integrase
MKRPREYRNVARISTQSFAAVIRAYLASPRFRDLGPATQRNYQVYLRLAEHPETLGGLPIGVIRPALVQQFLDGLSDRPGAQHRARVALKAVERFALVRDLLPYPITTGTETVKSDGGHVPWNDAQVATAEFYARPDISRAVTLAANTGQRGSDLFRMHWKDIEVIDGKAGINVKQQKTGRQLWIPFTQALQEAIASWERKATPLLLKPDGSAWGSRAQLSTAWLRERDRNPDLAPCAELVLHGLRGTACVRLKRAGASPLQISDMVGLSVKMVERYCRFASQKENAVAAVYHLDRTARERQMTDVGNVTRKRPVSY